MMKTLGQVFTKVDTIFKMILRKIQRSSTMYAYHQLEAFSLYLKDKPAESAAYRKFLVSIFSFVHAYIIVKIILILQHHHFVGALQL